MENPEDKDIIWEVLMYLTDTFGYRASLVVSDKGAFESFILMGIDIRPGIYGYIKIMGKTLIELYEEKGEKFLYENIDKEVSYNLEKLHRKWGDF